MAQIITKIGNLLDVTEGHIVHGCNAQGVMGSGVALAVRKKYPGAFSSYFDTYSKHGLMLGFDYAWVATPKLVIHNAITQERFGLPTRNCSYDAIQTCFEQIDKLVLEYKDYVPAEIHIPMIGAGLGGGNWNIIKTIIEETVSVPVTLWVLPT